VTFKEKSTELEVEKELFLASVCVWKSNTPPELLIPASADTPSSTDEQPLESPEVKHMVLPKPVEDADESASIDIEFTRTALAVELIAVKENTRTKPLNNWLFIFFP
jgi:hypothetical protein